MNIHPLTLTGRWVRLEPLALSHVPELCQVGLDEDIWRFMPYGTIGSPEAMRGWVEEMLRRASRGTDLPFAIVWRETGKAIGATRYMTISHPDRNLEIGGTWLGKAHQRTAANTEGKYLLLRHAFEALGCVRVQFRTDVRNTRSQAALERLGAVREGVLRKITVLPDGHQRDSVFYSILDAEWSAVKARLEGLMEKYK